MNNKHQSSSYYAVIFTSKLSNDTEGYHEMNEELLKIINTQKGFISIENSSNGQTGITISYWEDVQAILAWRENEWHKKAIAKGKSTWYESYTLRICTVVREYSFVK